MASDSFKLALAQLKVVGGAPDANLNRAEKAVAEAAGRGAGLVVLPEALDTGWAHPCVGTLAAHIPNGATYQLLRYWAVTYGISVCAGLAEREGERVYNAAVLIDRSGALLLHHRKIHELDFARAIYATGDRLNVADTPIGRVGLMICADAFAPNLALSRSLGQMGARLLVSPCAWAVPACHDNIADPYGQIWLDSYIPIAKEFGTWIAGVSNVGPINAGEWQGRKCIGCSLLIAPDGSIASQGPYGDDAETLLMTEITLLPD